MNQITIEELSAYFPYKVKVINEYVIKEIHGIVNDEIYLSYNDIGTDNNYCFVEDIRLILRPLSQLNTEIEVNGEKFVPIEKLSEKFRMHYELFALQNTVDFIVSDYNKLLSWHFDIFGLIDRNLAESIV